MPPYKAVFFDCDSTVVSIEGIDELSPIVADEIGDLTQQAMDGEVPFPQVFCERMELIRPCQMDVERVGEMYIECLVEDAKEVIMSLMSLGKKTFLISGGLRLAVEMLAGHLGIHTIAAIDVLFDEFGEYLSYDKDSPLLHPRGKAHVVREFKRKNGLKRRDTVFIGDGATDLDVRSEVDKVIGFGGVVNRPFVRRRADVYVDLPTFSPILMLTTTKEEQSLLEHNGFGRLVRKGREFLP